MAIDYRSDTMTLPTDEMKEYMMQAPVGDDVWGEDPTIQQFQKEIAHLLGKDSALFFPTATQVNLASVMAHCQRGEEYIVGQEAHCYKWEAGGAAVLGSVQPQPIDLEDDGTLNLTTVEKFIKPNDQHHAITKLLCIENTCAGKVLPIDYIQEARIFCDRHGLGLHMDGARVFNAAIDLDVEVEKITKYPDTITLCLSKGLGCPAGAVLVGDQRLISKAFRWRKMLGGAFRQGGILAASGQYALNHHIEDLAQDHENARTLSEGIRSLNDLRIQVNYQATNMLFVKISDKSLISFAKNRNILFPDGEILRLVTHRNISAEDIQSTLDMLKDWLGTCLDTNKTKE
ncbi:MAG: low-specificity L-threonine aldolase [Chlamydiota bacterium]